ncbi:hypothetical protein Pan189_40520 [Stratiformator vulcanicus]|uniref:Uncharacterized protein n=1 Tax=Stratiformator vulcanicus TaxID=2527980 RepID=A0A517R737_9PLAN|nr:hypothetical protein Pan189_40520 [Stratiformator vulcanicus]
MSWSFHLNDIGRKVVLCAAALALFSAPVAGSLKLRGNCCCSDVAKSCASAEPVVSPCCAGPAKEADKSPTASCCRRPDLQPNGSDDADEPTSAQSKGPSRCALGLGGCQCCQEIQNEAIPEQPKSELVSVASLSRPTVRPAAHCTIAVTRDQLDTPSLSGREVRTKHCSWRN